MFLHCNVLFWRLHRSTWVHPRVLVGFVFLIFSFLCRFVDCCLSFYFVHCIVCPSIYIFWLPLWYLQTILMRTIIIKWRLTSAVCYLLFVVICTWIWISISYKMVGIWFVYILLRSICFYSRTCYDSVVFLVLYFIRSTGDINMQILSS